MMNSRLTRFTVVVVVSALIAGCRAVPPATAITDELVARHNRGVGLMGQYDFGAAVAVFDTLHREAPDWPEATLNLAIAMVNRQAPDDSRQAELLLRALADAPRVGRRARYTLGLLLVHEGRNDDGLRLLSSVAEEIPPDGFAAYFVGQLRLAEAPADALEWYVKAAAREPLLRSAHYGAFLALRRLGRDAEASEQLERFQALERHPQATVAEFKYTRMGPLAEAVTVDATPSPAPRPAGDRFLAPVPLATDPAIRWRREPSRLHSITIAEIDGDGASDVFIAGVATGASPNAVLLRRGNGYVLDTQHPLARVSGVRAALWGDLDEDGLLDVVLCRPDGGTRILRQAEGGHWIDHTTDSGMRLGGMNIVDGAVFDADHDGDLDIWLVNATGTNELLSNDGSARFRRIGTVAGVQGDGRPSLGLAIADLDGDRDADVVVLKASPPHDIFVNDRGWQYRRDRTASALAASPATAIVAGDLDADGAVELYAQGPRGIAQWTRDESDVWQATLIAADTGVAHGRLAIADTDGNGVLEVVASTSRGWTVHESHAGGWRTALGDGFDATAPGGWALAVIDPAAGPAVIGLAESGEPLIWQPGPGRHGYLALQFSGRDPSSDQRRSNGSGIGTRAALRVGSRWTAIDTTRQESGPGQSLQPGSVGLGGAARADFIAVTWSDGVFQTELALDRGQVHRIVETQRQLSSCPVLFAWNGDHYRFVTDLLGTGGIGFFERPGVYSEPFPREHVLLPDSLLQPDGGRYRLKIAEPMEEITYLDHASLVAYDLPPGWQMVLDERKAVNGPPPTGDAIFYRDEQLAVRADDGRGHPLRETLAEADLRAAGPALVDRRFIGLAEPFTITLHFERPIDRGPGPPVLIVDGWVEYPYAQTVFAAWQADASFRAPTLEARGRDGQWRVVAREFGYPAGMPRRMAFPLPPLPAESTALRLTTSQEIYWDRIAVAYREESPKVVGQVLSLEAAHLSSIGFARRTTGPQRAPHYDDRVRDPLADTRHPRGWYTAFGAIDPLLEHRDDAVAIFGPGEAVSLDFTAPVSPPPPGWTRRLVLEAHGWCKDMDLYTRDGETVEPLPGQSSEVRRVLHERFNTRFAGGW